MRTTRISKRPAGPVLAAVAMLAFLSAATAESAAQAASTSTSTSNRKLLLVGRFAGTDPAYGRLLSGLFAERLRELPERREGPGAGESGLRTGKARIPLALHPWSADGRYPAIGTDTLPADADFLVFGQYRLGQDSLSLEVYGAPASGGAGPLPQILLWKGEGAPRDAGDLADAAQGALISWIANRPLAWIELGGIPAGARVSVDGIEVAQGATRHYLDYAKIYRLRVEKPGHASVEQDIAVREPGALRPRIELFPISGAPLFPDRVPWEQETEFATRRANFRTALGLLAVAVPSTILAVGNYNMYYESYYRNPTTFASAYETSRAVMIGASAACAALVVNAAVGLVRYLSSTR